MHLPVRHTHALPAIVAAAILTLLAACKNEPAPTATTQAAAGVSGSEAAAAAKPSVPDPDADAVDGAATGGDRLAFELHALTAEDIERAGLPGELACAFVREGGAAVLRAAGMVASQDPAVGIVKPAGVVETVRAPGGFDGILDDARFSASGMTIGIRTTGAAIGQGESPPRPALLTVQRADGAAYEIEGLWQCGP